VDERDPFAVLVDDDDVIVIDDAGDAVRVVGERPRAADAPSGPPAEGSRPRKKASARPAPGSPRPGGGAGGSGGSGDRRGTGGGGGSGGGGGNRPPRQPPPVDDAEATKRGFVVIAATVVVGLIVFWFGIHRPAENANEFATVGTEAPNVTTRNDAPAVTPPLPATTAPATPATAVAPAQLKIVVANGVDPAKVIAGPVVAKLAAKDYTQASAVDLPSSVPTSSVYFTEGAQTDAQVIAGIVGFPPTSVAPMPAKPLATLNGAKILVVVGKDQP
jgi:hypothetical protein